MVNASDDNFAKSKKKSKGWLERGIWRGFLKILSFKREICTPLGRLDFSKFL